MSSNKWWTSETLAVVTGGNKGIGLEIVRQLAENGLAVVLTARDVGRGTDATGFLHDKGLNNVVFHQLDVQNPASISAFVNWLKDNYGGLDILINNAAIDGLSGIDMDAARELRLQDHPSDALTNPVYSRAFATNWEQTKMCIDTNYYGAKRVTEALLPLFRPSAAGSRIVNVSSGAGLLQTLRNESLKQQLVDVSKLSVELVDEMVERFLDDIKSGNTEGKGWPPNLAQYCISKIALNAYGRILARDYCAGKDDINNKLVIYVNNVHPGSVRTDMNPVGDLTAAQGAESCVTVALSPPGGPSGQFFSRNELHSF